MSDLARYPTAVLVDALGVAIAVPSHAWAADVASRMGDAVALLERARAAGIASGAAVTAARSSVGAVTPPSLDAIRAELTRTQLWMLSAAHRAFVAGFTTAGDCAFVFAQRLGDAARVFLTGWGEGIAALTEPVRDEAHWQEVFGLVAVVVIGIGALYFLGLPGVQTAIAAQGIGAGRAWPILAAGGSRAFGEAGRGAGTLLAATGAGGGKALAALPGLVPTSALRP